MFNTCSSTENNTNVTSDFSEIIFIYEQNESFYFSAKQEMCVMIKAEASKAALKKSL